jgi:hypothetical protein
VLSGARKHVLSGARLSCHQAQRLRLAPCNSRKKNASNSSNKKSFGFLLTVPESVDNAPDSAPDGRAHFATQTQHCTPVHACVGRGSLRADGRRRYTKADSAQTRSPLPLRNAGVREPHWASRSGCHDCRIEPRRLLNFESKGVDVPHGWRPLEADVFAADRLQGGRCTPRG